MNKITKKRFSLLVSIMLALSVMFTNLMATTVFAEEYSGVSTVSASAVELDYEGEEQSYEVWFEPNAEFSSFYLKLELPEFVEITDAETNYALGADKDGFVGSMTGSGAGGYTCEFMDNVVAVSLSGASAITGNVELFTLTVSAIENIDYTGHVRVVESQFIDSNENELEVDFELGDITVNAKESLGAMGDMDGDNDVDLIDLVTVQRSITDLTGEYALNDVQLVLADVNCDGAVDMIDCQLIRKYIVGLIDSLENYNNPVNNYYELEVYYGYGDNFTLEGEYTVKEGVNIYSYLEDLAYQKSYNVLSFWYSYPYNAISSEDVMSYDTKAYLLLENKAPEYYMYSFYTNANGEYEYVGFVDGYVGETYLQVAERLQLGNIYGIYLEREEINEVSSVIIADNVLVYIDVLPEPEAPSEYKVTVNFENISNGEKGNAGDYTVPANVSLVEYLTEVALSNDAKVESVYLDADYVTPIDYGYIINSDLEVWVIVSNVGGDENPNTEYYMFVYASTQNGFKLVQQLSVYEGDNISDIIYQYYAEMMEIVDGVYYDEAMTEVSYDTDVVTGNVNVYLYAEEMHGNGGSGDETDTYYISLYGNTADGGWEYAGQLSVPAGTYIIETINGYFGEYSSYIEGFYYDTAMTSPVGARDTVSGNIDVYMYSSKAGEDVGGGENVGKEEYIYVDLVSEDGQNFGSKQIPMIQGECILQSIRNFFGNWEMTVYTYDEVGSEITDDLIYGEHTTNAFYVNVIPVFINVMSQECQLLNRIMGYGFEGDMPKQIAVQFAMENGYNNYYQIAPDGLFEGSFAEEDVITNNMEIYIMVESYSEESGIYCFVTIMEQMNGVWVESTGRSKRMPEGTFLIEIGDSVVAEMMGTLYNVDGYYYDVAMTREISASDVLEKEGTEIYVKVSLKDLSGDYAVMSMQNEELGTLIVNADGSATFNKVTVSTETGEKVEVPYTGEWLVMSGMFFFNYGTYSQNIFMIQLMESSEEGSMSGITDGTMTDTENGAIAMKGMAMLMSEFYAEEYAVQEKYSAVAGDYVWYEEMMEEMGVDGYYITLYANGVCELTAMGMTMRMGYEVVTSRVILLNSQMMGGEQYFNINKATGEATMNYVAQYVGEYTVLDTNGLTIGTLAIGFDGSGTYTTTSGSLVAGTIEYSGEFYLMLSEVQFMHFGISYSSENTISHVILYNTFDGSSYPYNPDLDAIAGTYDVDYYESEYTVKLLNTGVFKLESGYGYFVMGTYEVVETGLYLYENGNTSSSYMILNYDAELGKYVMQGYGYNEEQKEETVHDIVEGYYTLLDVEGTEIYVSANGTVIIEQLPDYKEEFAYKYDGKIVYIENGMNVVLNPDEMTAQLVVSSDLEMNA